ncbi:MAG TPA: translation initiation factor eIF-1A [Candidatus Norongarragalinales archaeon]|nr:translation initiation factor eIF-1A [Candidatus Norongarragalinales archaeon]
MDSSPPGEIHLRLPRKGEIFGIVKEMHGGSRMTVECADGKERLCRIPGKIKMRVWVKPNDVVLIMPWSVEGDTRGDITYRYIRPQVEQLQRKGLIKGR